MVRTGRVGQALCLAGAGIGALGLIGWLAGIPLLTMEMADQPPMMPNTAVALLLTGLSAAARRQEHPHLPRHICSVMMALVVLVIGAGTLAEYALAIEIRIDELLIRNGVGPHPGRPSPLTAFALTALGAALVLFDLRPSSRARPSEWLTLTASIAALAAAMGQIFGAHALYRLARAPVIGVAIPTAVGLLLVSLGMLLERPAAGVMRVVTSKGPGGTLLRRLTLPAILGPTIFGLIITRTLAIAGVADLPVVIAILTAVTATFGVALLAVVAARLNLAHHILEMSEARTRDFVEQAADGIFVADLDGRYIDVNRAGCEMLGYSREEIVAKSITDLIPPQDVDRLGRSKEQMLEGKIHVDEWRFRRSDGTYLPVEVSAKILPDGRWQGLARDISERKLLEERLRLSEARSSGILSISADAIISINDAQRISMFNEGAERIFGYSKAEAIGAPLEILIPARFRDAHREHVRRFAESHETSRRMGSRTSSIVGLRRNGEEFPADAAISRLEVGGTRILTVALRDVTEQRRAETEQTFLAETGRLLATAFDYEEPLARIAALAVRDLADLCVIDIVEENGEVRRLEVVHRDPSKAWLCASLKGVQLDRKRPHLVERTLRTGEAVLLEHVSPDAVAALTQSEEYLRLLRAAEAQSIITVPLLAHGKLLGAMALVSSTVGAAYGPADLRLAREVAHRAAFSIENARLHRAARRAIQARDEVLGIVAHDLRNPLGVVLMQTGLLQRRGGGDEAARRPLHVIERAVARMNCLIQDLLDVTRLEAGCLSIDQERVSTARVVAESVDAQKALASSARLDLRLDVADETPDVWADHDRLVQVFENLIGNSVKFTRPGGCITVGAARRAGDVLFWVADTGTGIPAEHLPHLFDRFWQARREDRRGAGLGLPIVKGIVEAHGGRVWCESTPGRGSVFFFTVPAATGDEERRAPPGPP